MTQRLLALGALVGIAAGAVLHAVSLGAAGDVAWTATTGAVLAPLAWSVARALLRGDVGVDAIALVAMCGALALGEQLAGCVVALMLAGGNALEEAAARRARRELSDLVSRAPRIANRRRGDHVEEVPADALVVGDLVVVRAGEVVPADGIVTGPVALVDESALTGESLPVEATYGSPVHSGTTNAGEAFEARVTRPAAASAYATLVRLVRDAESRRAPFVRLADRYAIVLLPVTLAVAGVAWGVSGDAVRALAVLVVATPCPLILAAPIAFVSGMSRAARLGIVVKGGDVIERLGEARTVLLDKTGTLTLGTPEVERVISLDGIGSAETLRLAASLDQLSAHALAASIVRHAHGRRLELSFPGGVVERAGQGIEGVVDERRVAVGSAAWLEERGFAGANQAAAELDVESGAGRAKVLVGVDGHLAGAVVMADRLRPDAGGLAARLRDAGIHHVALVSGDREAVAVEVGRLAGLDRVYAEQTPEQKLDVVRSLQATPGLRPVVMVGDGINDAPALALADVGIAMGAAGATASSEAADAVIVVDRVDRVADAVRIGRRSLAIAKQSVGFGIGLSLVAMGFAAAGFVAPVFGALLQEGIDVAVIANALRALGGEERRES